MTTSEDKLRDIKTRISQAIARKSRAEVEQENALERRKQALAALKEDFGVETAEDIQRIKTELQQTVDDAVVEVTSALDKG